MNRDEFFFLLLRRLRLAASSFVVEMESQIVDCMPFSSKRFLNPETCLQAARHAPERREARRAQGEGVHALKEKETERDD